MPLQPWGSGAARLSGLAVRLVLTAERAELAQLQPVRVVTPVLPRDVVAVLALLAGQRDLGPDIGRSHGECLSLVRSVSSDSLPSERVLPGMMSAPTGASIP